MGDTIAIKVQALTAETAKDLSALERHHFPYALAKTLTDVAAMAVRAVQARTRQEFKLHTEFIPRGIARISAKKSDVVRTGIGTAIVFTKPIISGWMPVHETGGERKPKGKALAIPAEDLLKKAFQTSTGRIKTTWKPSTLLAGYRPGRRNVSMSGGLTKATRGGRKGKPFIIRGKDSGVPMIVRRKSPKRYPLELLYIFSRRAAYKPVWAFEKTVDEIVDLRFKSRLHANLKIAIKG